MLNCSRIMVHVPLKLNPPSTVTSNQRKTALKSPSAVAYSTNNNSSSNNQTIDTDNLRTQLAQLQAEAETTRSKANNSRLRLMRLSEAAENLQMRAAQNVLVGKETEARELLIQKKRLMQALEKSKNRIDVLDNLAVKINEAISLKEAQLIGNVASSPDFTQEESGNQIRFVNPKVYNNEDSNENNGSGKHSNEADQDDDRVTENYEENLLVDLGKLSTKEPSNIDTSNLGTLAGNLSGISSYKDFLKYVDSQLQQVELDLSMFLRLSTLILEDKEKQTSTKVEQTSGLLQAIRSIRERVASIMKSQIDGQSI